MGFKEDFSRQMTRFGKNTSAFVKESRLRTVNSGLEADMKSLYRTVGETAYCLWKEGKLEADQLKPYFTEIYEKEAQVLENKELICRIQQKSQEETAATAEPAPVGEPGPEPKPIPAGEPKPEPGPEPRPTPVFAGEPGPEPRVPGNAGEVGEWSSLERIYCPNCGREYPLTANYCRKCGTKLH